MFPVVFHEVGWILQEGISIECLGGTNPPFPRTFTIRMTVEAKRFFLKVFFHIDFAYPNLSRFLRSRPGISLLFFAWMFSFWKMLILVVGVKEEIPNKNKSVLCVGLKSS